MSKNGKHWRSKLLIDLSTGQIVNESDPNFTSDRFIPDSYDPTNNVLNPCSNKYDPPNNNDSIIPNIECDSCQQTGQDPRDLFSLNSTLINNCFEEVCNETFDPNFSFDAIEDRQPLIAASSSEVSQAVSEVNTQVKMIQIATGLRSPSSTVPSNCNLELDEQTGLFVPSTISSGMDNAGIEPFLDEVTGELRALEQQVVFSNSDDDSEAYSKRKSRVFNKNRRLNGKNYTSRKRIINENGKCSYEIVVKTKRFKKDKPCPHGATVKTSRSFVCGEMCENQRESIFRYFWSLDSWGAKKAYIKNLISVRPVIRRRKQTQKVSAKHTGYDYKLPNENNELVRVCKKFFISTLDINNNTLSDWATALSSEHFEIENGVRRKSRKTNLPERQLANPKSCVVKEWLTLLPKVPSHYCRSSSKRVYVESTFHNKSHLYRVYKKWCLEHEKSPAHRTLFSSVLRSEKISIYKPRKDQCDTCTAFKEKNITQEEYDEHIDKKLEAYAAKKQALSMCSPEVLVITMDVQGVLLCPKLKVSVQYYKQKLQLHNFTIYCNNNKEVQLYVWHEGDGGVSANEFTSCLIHFLKLKIPDGYKKIILISDGCSYQNRNKILSSALLNLSTETNVELEQLILEKGHTMMEVDSVHSTLEGLFKAPIYTANDYLSIMRHARPAKPYVVHHLDYNFFKNYEKICQFSSIRPGKKAGDAVVADLRGILYKSGTIYYKLRHPEVWKLLPQRQCTNSNALLNLYNSPQKIDKSKFDSLQSLKKYMHRDHHHFYDSLHHD